MVIQQSTQRLHLASASHCHSVPAGAPTVRQTLTVHNPSSLSTQLEVWLAPVDVQSESVLQWVGLENSQGIFQIEPYSACEIVLQFNIPYQAALGLYSYEIRAQSSARLGDYLRCYQQLIIEPPLQESCEPDLSLEPVTNALNPYRLKPQETCSFKVRLSNRAHLPDCFFLTCLDIAPNWFTVNYPATQVLRRNTVGLPLQPGEAGEIDLSFHLPPQAPAGLYTLTLRLSSQQQPETILFEAVYLEVAADDSLTTRLYPEIAVFPTPDQKITVEVTNNGNVDRQLTPSIREPRQRFDYTLTPPVFSLAPGERQTVTIVPRLRSQWQQLWRRQGADIPFTLELRDSQARENSPVATCEGQLRWRCKRPWLPGLVTLSLVSGGVISASLFAWWGLIYRPNVKPQILTFDTAQATYRAGDTPAVAFDWEVSNREEIEQLRLIYQADNGEDYELYSAVLDAHSLPTALQTSCKTVVTHQDASAKAALIGTFRQLSGKSPTQKHLSCHSFKHPALTLEEGKHQFRLEVLKSADRFQNTPPNTPPTETPPAEISPTDTVILDVAIAAAGPPNILELSTTAAEYKIAGGAAQPQSGLSQPGLLQSGQLSPAAAPIQLSWAISNAADIQALKLVSTDSQGVANTEPISYRFERGIAPRLQPYCQVVDNQLRCNAIPTAARQAGDYTFYLTVIPRRDHDGEEIVKQTTPVSIRPPAPEIAYFKVNGQDVRQNPKRVHVLQQTQTPANLTLSWQVSEGAQIELLPAPGSLNQATGELTYPLSPTEGTETLTLRATNPQTGEETSQSVVIEKVKTAQVLRMNTPNFDPAPGYENRAVPIQPLNLNQLPLLPPLPVPAPPPPPR